MIMKTWHDVDEGIRDIGLLTIQRNKLEGEFNARIATLKEKSAVNVQTLDSEIAELERHLNEFCEANREDMSRVKGGKGLTWHGVFGKIAFRACPPAITFVRKNLQKVLSALKARKLWNCIRTVEEPNKEAMELLDASTLKAVGATRGAAEKFELKPDYKKIEQRPST